MKETREVRPVSVRRPLGETPSLESLPSSDTRRWVIRRKAEVVAAVACGLLTVREACDRYKISGEEFAGWQRAVNRAGPLGLRVTRIQFYRDLWDEPE